jgi:hypothetical protein
MAPQTTTTTTASARIRPLLTAGIVAGPLFLVVWFVQAMVRDGFDPHRHPISLLALGGAGWVQIANFVLAGSLFIACAVGMRRAMGATTGGGCRGC